MSEAARTPRRGTPQVLGAALAAGLALGLIDLLAQRALPYPWANLANSAAVWAVGAFALGAWARAGLWRPALAGVVLLVVAVESYHLAAAVVLRDALANLWMPTTLVWLCFGVLAGAVFGTFGSWWRSEAPWRSLVGLAALGGVFLAEAGVLLRRLSSVEAAYRSDGIATAVIMAVIGVALVLALGRGLRRFYALGLAVPLAALGFAGFTAAGFGG